MEVKICNPMKTLTFSAETSLNEMGQFVRVKAMELHKEAIENGMEITGPVYWIYTGADGNPQTRFQLDICVPVFCNKPYNGKFQLKVSPEFKYVSTVHSGSWFDIGPVYHHLFSRIFSDNHNPNGITREVYVNMDFENPENNITEIQVGVI